jgi:hypothetical protein
MTGPQAAWLPGGRLHLQHGPIDLVIGAEAPEAARRAAFARAAARFATVLGELAGELPLLRRPADPAAPPAGAVALRMWAACLPHRPLFVTPMAAVAGAVAETVLAAMTDGLRLRRAYVNNGGDIALHLGRGAAFRVAIWDRGDAGRVEIGESLPVRGIATSGWRGRSHSLGIADAVTVLARSAAEADVAATLIANAVDLPGHPAIARKAARVLAPDSDLGDLPVTTGVGPLGPAEIAAALARGQAAAAAMVARGLIAGAALFLAGESRTAGRLSSGTSGGDRASA